MNNKNIAIIVIILAIIFTLIAPYLLTSDLGFISFKKGSNEIGDTIGGTTAPIIGIMGAILVYLALKEQVEANRLIDLQIQNENRKEFNRLDKIKKLIIWDLETNMEVGLVSQNKELSNGIESIKTSNNESFFTTNFTQLNLKTYESIEKIDLFSVFEDNFYKLTMIYDRIEDVKKFTFSNLLTERESIEKDTTLSEEIKKIKLDLTIKTWAYNIEVSKNIQLHINDFLNIYKT